MLSSTLDADNRLVADALESEWNEKLRELREAEADHDRRRVADQLELDQRRREQIQHLIEDFPKLWQDPRTPCRERKRMARLIIEDVTLVKGDQITVHVRFRGGTLRTLILHRSLASWEEHQTTPEVVAAIDRLVDGHSDAEIAAILNDKGLVSGWGKPFDPHRVKKTRLAYSLKSRFARARDAGFVTHTDLARRLGVARSVVTRKHRQGVLGLETRRIDTCGHVVYKLSPELHDDSSANNTNRPEEV